MEPSVFTRILDGDIPGQVIVRDDTAAALLTIEPFTPGHVLIVPVQQVDHLWDLDEETYVHVMALARRMAHVIRRAYPEYKRIGEAVEGFEVPHAHVHIFGMSSGMGTLIPEFQERQDRMATPEQLAAVAERLRSAL